MAKHIPPEKARKILDAIAAGMSKRDVEHEFGVCRATINAILRSPADYQVGTLPMNRPITFRTATPYRCRGCETATGKSTTVNQKPCPACIAREAARRNCSQATSPEQLPERPTEPDELLTPPSQTATWLHHRLSSMIRYGKPEEIREAAHIVNLEMCELVGVVAGEIGQKRRELWVKGNNPTIGGLESNVDNEGDNVPC